MLSASRTASTALAAVRIFNGALGLFAARSMARRLGTSLAAEQTFVYPARMFGIRTLALGVDLLVARGTRRRSVLRQAVLIHGADSAAAAYAGWRGELNGRAARLAVTVSTLNTALAATSLITLPDL